MTSYLTSMDTISLSRTVSEIFDFKVFRVWPWPLTPKGHLGSKNCISLESPYMTSYLTSMDTISLSRTVSEIFDFKVFRVWPWPLTPKGHLGSKNFIPLESPYMTSYLTSMDTISLSRTVLEIMPVKNFRVKQNGGFWPFKGQGHWPIFFISRKRVWLSPNGVDWHIARQNRFGRFGCTLIKERKKLKKKKKKKKKKDEPLYVGYVYLRPGKFLRNEILLDYSGRWRNQSCQIFFQSVHSGVSGKGSNFAIFSVNRGWPLQLLYYRTTVILH